MKKISFVLSGVILAVLLCVSFATGVFAAEDGCEIASVTLNKSKAELTLEIKLPKDYVKENKSETLYLFELAPYQSADDINTLEPVKSFKIGNKITSKLSFYNGNVTRLYSGFVVAIQNDDSSYTALTNTKYIDNPEALAENTESYPTKSSKKGLGLQMFSDAQQLGVMHTVVNVAINEYMLGENSDNAQSFIYNGRTFYINKNKLRVLDHTVKTYTDAGINVYFNIILSAPKAEDHENIKSLYCEGISADAKRFALNTENENAMHFFRAFMDYITARYTQADHAYGFVPGIILGYEVNSNRVWNNAGPTDLESYVSSYCTAFRIAYTAMTSHYSEGRVYISLANNFSVAEGDTAAVPGSLCDYPAKDFLDLFAETIKASGDIPWGLSINPYASDTSLTDYWNDTQASDSFETPYITMKNINTLTRYMNEERLLYNSEPRSIIIGEFGVSGDPGTDNSMTMQAAAYALAYYTADQNEDIDAFIYHGHVDHSGEARYYGLWTNKEGSVSEPAAKKPIYNVFSLIDTEQSEAVTAFVKQTVGDNAFNAVMSDNVKYKIFNKRTLLSSEGVEASDFAKGYTEKTLFDLTVGDDEGFYPTDGINYLELRPTESGDKTALYALMNGTPTEYKGIGNTIADGAFDKAQYITVRMMVNAPSSLNSLDVMVRLQSMGDAENDTVVFVGEASIKPNEWQEVSFKIKDLVSAADGDVDLIKLWVKTPDSAPEEGEYGIWLESVVIHTKNGMGFFGWFFTILLILLLLAVAAYGVLYLRAQYIRKQRRLAAERRRREMLRRGQMMQTQQTQNIKPPQSRPSRRPGDTQDFDNRNI